METLTKSSLGVRLVNGILPAGEEKTSIWKLHSFWAAIFIAIGILLRVVPYFVNRAFWLDETSVALNIRFRGFLELFKVLDYEQTMPIPILLFTKLLTVMFGTAESIFRLPALLAGIALLFVVWFGFSKLFGKTQALISLALVAGWYPLIYYSSELKQYEVDALMTAILLWVGLSTLRNPDASFNSLSIWGCVAILVSQPSVFILAALGMAAAYDKRFWQSDRWRWSVVLTGLVWVALFVAIFFWSYKTVSSSDFMRKFWADYFINPGSPQFVFQAKETLRTLFGGDYFYYMRLPMLVPLFLLGVFGIYRSEDRKTLLVAVLPIVLLFVASAMRQYPYATRLYLFTVPLIVWIFSAAVVASGRFFRGRMQSVIVVAFGAFLATSLVANALTRNSGPLLVESLRQTVDHIRKVDKEAPVYISFGRYRTWSYYAGDWNTPDPLKKNLDAVESCSTCDWKVIMNKRSQPDLVGRRPVGFKSDDEWLQHEARRILSVKDDHVWLVLSFYEDGLAKTRPWERLNQALEKNGLVPESTYSMGDTKAVYYGFKDREVAHASRPDQARNGQFRQ